MEEKLNAESQNLNKRLYKLLILVLKYTPITLAIDNIIYTILAYYEYNCYFLSYLGGVSILFLIILYIISYVFRFCYLYRIPLYYITITSAVALYDEYIRIPLSDLQMVRMYSIIFGLSVVYFIYCKFKKKC
jgi:hypothetical protein